MKIIEYLIHIYEVMKSDKLTKYDIMRIRKYEHVRL